jgi:hypothetical protein
MLPLIFRVNLLNINHFLSCFPNSIIDHFVNELHGILHYIYLIQSSIDFWSHYYPLMTDVVVYRRLKCDGGKLASLYISMIEEVIVWVGFTKASTQKDYVIECSIVGENSILFEIWLQPGAVAVCIDEDVEGGIRDFDCGSIRFYGGGS